MREGRSEFGRPNGKSPGSIVLTFQALKAKGWGIAGQIGRGVLSSVTELPLTVCSAGFQARIYERFTLPLSARNAMVMLTTPTAATARNALMRSSATQPSMISDRSPASR